METLRNDGISDSGVGIYKVTKQPSAAVTKFDNDKPESHKSHKVLTADIPDRSKIKIIREHEPHYIVFLDKDNNLRWLFGEHINVKNDTEAQRVLMEVRHAAATPRCLDDIHHDAWIKMLAHAVSLIADGHATFAMEIVNRAKDFLDRRAKEKAREWVVDSSILISAAIFISCIGIHLLMRNQDQVISLIMAVLGFGVVGAQFSILVRLDSMNVDPVSKRNVYWKDAFIRIMTGVFSALITYIALKSETVFGFVDMNIINNSPSYTILTDKNFWIMAVMVVIAGFSERFVPSFLGKMEERETIEELDTQKS